MTSPTLSVVTFASPVELFDAVFGKRSASELEAERAANERWLATQREAAERGAVRAQDFVAEIAENAAQRLAQLHGYNVASLTREQASISRQVAANAYGAHAHARQLSRAIEIAHERAALMIAAE